MPLDAICLSAVVRETAAQVENTRIEKIQQPAPPAPDGSAAG